MLSADQCVLTLSLCFSIKLLQDLTYEIICLENTIIILHSDRNIILIFSWSHLVQRQRNGEIMRP